MGPLAAFLTFLVLMGLWQQSKLCPGISAISFQGSSIWSALDGFGYRRGPFFFRAMMFSVER